MRFEVIVGNVGRVECTDDRLTAAGAYRLYVELSKRHEGRCAGESVTLFDNGEIVWEHEGRHDAETDPCR